MTNLEFDSLAAFVLLATALIGAYAPVILAKWGTAAGGPGHRSLAYVLGNMLSAGVMLSAGFVHLLGESVMELEDVTRFPLATFLCGVGFLVTLLADSVMEVMSGGKGNPTGTPTAALCCGALPVLVPDSPTPLHHISIVADGQATQQQSHWEGPSSLSRSFEIGEPSLSRAESGLSGKHLEFAEDGSPLHPEHRADSMRLRNSVRHPVAPSTERASPVTPPHSPQALLARQSPRSMDVDRSRRRVSHSPNRHPRDEPSHYQVAGSPGASMSGHFGQRLPSEMPNGVDGAQDQDDGNGQEPLLEHISPSDARRQGVSIRPSPTAAIKTKESPHVQVSFLTAALMAVALCVHSLLEGAALGAQREIAKTFHIFVAILAHKGLAAYALGSSIVDSNASMERYWTVICLFAFATPAGIFIGFLLANVSETDGAAAISSLASGTFLYVALMEVIPRELIGMEHRAMKLLMLVLGFGAMSLLAIWA